MPISVQTLDGKKEVDGIEVVATNIVQRVTTSVSPVVQMTEEEAAVEALKKDTSEQIWVVPKDHKIEEWNLGIEEDPKLVKIKKI